VPLQPLYNGARTIEGGGLVSDHDEQIATPAAEGGQGRLQELWTAIDGDDEESVERLLAAEPGLVGARGDDGVSALLRALYRRRYQALEALLAADPTLDLFEAAALGRVDRVGQLVAADPAAVTARSADGFTALHLASFFHHPATAALLVDAGADVDTVAENPMRVTPLHSAVAVQAHEIAALLLERGANPDAAQVGGFTALHSAAHRGDLEMIDLLLAYGADRDRKTDDGRAAADFAEADGHAEAAAKLREG
jgi:ankyrin repeat protein